MLLYALCFPHELFLTDQKLQIQILSLLPKLKVPPQACLVTREEAPIPSTQRLPVFLEESQALIDTYLRRFSTKAQPGESAAVLRVCNISQECSV